jgi:serine/threonine-protein kinase RsbW
MPTSDPLLAALTIPSNLSALPEVRLFVEAFCREARADAKSAAAVILAVHEAVTNVIRHAHSLQSELPVSIECILLADGVEVRIRDQGPPFDISAVPLIDPGQLREGGRGVYLIRSTMDEVETTQHATGGNTLRMVKRFGQGR